ncbi:MAG: COX15/CtaA family protein [Betaproteobacteria bacterium]|nr:COX15/CtaA family protein [Betaproteobacteria bacterium]
MSVYRPLVCCAAVLTFLVVVVGAYVRLEDAGLGCPDWPGCYGQILGVPDALHEVEKAERAFPGKPVDAGRAWKEMFHRYLAGTLGLLVLAIAVIAWRKRGEIGRSPALPVALVAVVAFQATLGMWTVTMLLKPAIVTLHLLGGMTTLALLTWLALREIDPQATPAELARALRPWSAVALAVLVAQIALGGWVSANYAALACTDFPTCHGRWLPEMDFGHAFHVVRELGVTAAGEPLSQEALNAIQWVHRLGALVAVIVVGGLVFGMLRAPALRVPGAVIGVLLVTQAGLGIANVLLRLPLVLAAAHNAVAALLLVALVMLNFVVFRKAN